MTEKIEWKVLGTAIDYSKTLITVNGIILVASVSLLTTFAKDRIDALGLGLLAVAWVLVVLSLIAAYQAVSYSIDASSKEERIIDEHCRDEAQAAAAATAPATTPPTTGTTAGATPTPADNGLPAAVWVNLFRMKYQEKWPKIANRANQAALAQLGALVLLAAFGLSHVLGNRFSLETELDAVAAFIKSTKNLPTKPQIVSFERDDKAGVYHLVYEDGQKQQYRCDFDMRLAAMRKCY